MDQLKGLKVAILVEDGFEQVELTKPQKSLDAAGANTQIVSPRRDQVRAWNFREWGEEFPVDVPLSRALAQDFDALLLPGGVMNPDRLRMQPAAVEFVKSFFDAGKPVAVICHGPWTVIEAGAARGRRIASWPSLKTDLANAGADWVDEEVVVDGGLVSRRKPDDIPAFNREMIAVFARRQVGRAAA
jgi:protease I